MDPLRNPKDPLHDASQPSARELFRHIGELCSGFSNDQVLDAAMNLVINSLRQTHSTWARAETAFDETFGRSKTILRGHYDSISGRKKGVFPYDQVLMPSHTDFRHKK